MRYRSTTTPFLKSDRKTGGRLGPELAESRSRGAADRNPIEEVRCGGRAVFVCRAYLRQFRDGSKATSGEREGGRGERDAFEAISEKGPGSMNWSEFGYSEFHWYQ